MDDLTRRNLKLARKLAWGCVLMFGFGFALVPLYDVFCEVTGLNGKVSGRGDVTIQGIDQSRKVTVQLTASNNEGMPWRFKPVQSELKVFPGETRQTAYLAFNPTTRHMVGQAVPSVSPSEAAEYLHKVNCFCFDQQPLAQQEEKEMPLLFVIDPALPKHITTITLSYTIFDITPQQTDQVSLQNPDASRRYTL